MAKYDWNEAAGTLSNGAVAIAQNHSRDGLIISNNSDTVMTVREGGQVATAAIGISIPAGTAIEFSGGRLSLNAFSLFCAGSSKAYTIYEW